VKTLLYAVLPLALLAGAVALIWQGLRTPPPEPSGPAQEQPRFAVTGARWLRLGAGGQPEFRAQAAAIDYYADGSARLRAVGLDALGGHESPWHLEAPAGESPPRARRFQLTGGVRGTADRPDGGTVAFATDRLWVDLLRRELYTEATVRLQTDLRSASARGLRADFDGERVQLLGDVRVDYAPGG
jgi:LPS export ABC transporter protein LptC